MSGSCCLASDVCSSHGYHGGQSWRWPPLLYSLPVLLSPVGCKCRRAVWQPIHDSVTAAARTGHHWPDRTGWRTCSPAQLSQRERLAGCCPSGVRQKGTAYVAGLDTSTVLNKSMGFVSSHRSCLSSIVIGKSQCPDVFIIDFGSPQVPLGGQRILPAG